MTASIRDLTEADYELTFDGPSDYEQLIVELVNRARLDPEGEASLQETTLGSGVSATPSQPLAVVGPLDAAAQAHSDAMLDEDFFSHTNPNDGSSASDRAEAAGYGAGAGENISFHVGFFAPHSADAMVLHHDNLWDSLGHRQNFMSARYSEIGVGHASGVYTDEGFDWRDTSMLTQNFGDRGLVYLTGVVIDDLDGDAFYDVGEGQGGVRISAVSADGAFATSTWSAGGYALALEAGVYDVRFEGGELDGVVERVVTIGDANVKLDIVEDRDATTPTVDRTPAIDDAPDETDTEDPEPAEPSPEDPAPTVDDAPAEETRVVSGGAGDDVIDGGAAGERILARGGDDEVRGGRSDDTILGGAGRDALYGREGGDVLRGGAGDDSLDGGAGDDVLRGGGGNDSLEGGGGDDGLRGGGGDDALIGGAGADALHGGRGDDRLEGGGARDVLTGGAGADVFAFDVGDGIDAIRDFDIGRDAIDLSAFGFADVADVLDAATQLRAGVRLTLSDDDEVTIRRVDLDDLGASDFIL